MLISKKYQFIFIHIYKNAGSSITNALRPRLVNRFEWTAIRALKKIDISIGYDPQPFRGHIRADELIERMGKETFESYFSFAIVRNPWDWNVSLYTYMLKNKKHELHEFVKSFVNFESYIKWRCQAKKKPTLQRDFIYSKNNKLLVDFVGRFENIETDFEKICDSIGISASLPKLNVSNTKPYQQFYKAETRKLVGQTYKLDIETFGYDF